jgi:hypothetical protein
MTPLTGLWRRELLVAAGGARDDTTQVWWLQGLSYYVDLRVPTGDGAAESSVEGFAGVLIEQDGRHHWGRQIDLHAPGPYPDTGTLSWDGPILVETGWHTAYVERWRREMPTVGPCWGLQLLRPTGQLGLLVRVGALFGWAQGQVPVDGDVPCTDGEVSIGRVDGARWTVIASSVPGRPGVLREAGAGLLGRGWSVAASEGRPTASEITAVLG